MARGETNDEADDVAYPGQTGIEPLPIKWGAGRRLFLLYPSPPRVGPLYSAARFNAADKGSS